MRPEYFRLAGLQGAITIICAITAYFIGTPLAAKSVAYGSSVALVGTLFLAWRFHQGEARVEASAEWYLRQAYRAEVLRFAWAAAMLAAGFWALRLSPPAVLGGFVATQLAWLLHPVWGRPGRVQEENESMK